MSPEERRMKAMGLFTLEGKVKICNRKITILLASVNNRLMVHLNSELRAQHGVTPCLVIIGD